MIKDFAADDPEVTEFRRRIFVEDLSLGEDDMATFNDWRSPNKLAYWFSNKKFVSNGFDRVLLYYHNNQAVSIAGGTHFNKNLYRAAQMYYILKSVRKVPGLNTLHFRPNGFFDWQVERAKELNCRGVFISIDLFDRRHEIMYNAMKNDVVGPGHMPNEQRKYTAKNLIYPEGFFNIKNTPQKICYYDIHNAGVDFAELFNDS